MAIQLSFWTNGYMGHGYSTLVLGVGSAGRQALYNFDLPIYCDDTYSLARVVYINDDSAIKIGGASEPNHLIMLKIIRMERGCQRERKTIPSIRVEYVIGFFFSQT